MRPALLILSILLYTSSFSQENDFKWQLGVLGGITNYQGDLQPNSFSFKHANPVFQFWVRRFITPNFSIRSGIGVGKLSANDKYNRDYLQLRNLNFTTSIQEGFLKLDFNLFDIEKTSWTPYAYGGIVVFHYNPYTTDTSGTKYYLKPLRTEGQGLAEYPDRKPYKLTQLALAFGGGLKINISNKFIIGLELSQRKTFTDYLDDVSNSYVDKEILRSAKGTKALELAFRSNEINNAIPYPSHGEQRGTPKEMDWYYYAGLSVEFNLSTIGYGLGSLFKNKKDVYNWKCPRNF